MTQYEDKKIQDVLEALEVLSPTAAEAPRPAAQALAEVQRRITPRPVSAGRFAFFARHRTAFAALMFVGLIAVTLLSPAVRAAASDFLGLFRVQKFAAVSISPQQLALLEEVAGSGLYPGEIEMIDPPGEPQSVDSLEQAQTWFDRSIRVPNGLGEPFGIFVTDGGRGRLIINVENARRLLRAAGVDPALIPDTLDGQAVDVTIYPAVSQQWDDVVLVQSPSPLVAYPDDVDVVALGEALLQFLGLNESQARRLASSIDWTNTLLLPIPENVATFNEVRADGSPALLLSSLDGRQVGLLWQKEGVVYALSGSSGEELIEIANSLHS
jgi:anti-sigma factor RsiW